ncbi:Kelch repeat-containing protein [Corallococcus sicarius]|uniref:Kelch repeat-containing protein n=1 Tax=Corallococcus sicarius TaxID=2316726 RepID=UPI001FC95EC9|nr:kelch repeat-containing protein [Corallococcus sicarius]
MPCARSAPRPSTTPTRCASRGAVSGITITADQTALVAILLQEVNPEPPFQNEAPIIDALVANATSIVLGGTLTLQATAHDPNTGDTLTYAWTSTGGSFSTTTAASTTWTAPGTVGIQTLTVTVTDSGGLSSSASLAIHVFQGAQQGLAQLSITFNRFPSVSALAASPTLLATGQATTVSATASDPEGDSLSYAWTSSCAGTWNNPASITAQFTPSALPAGNCNNCRLTVAVSDGRGGSTTGTVALCVSNAPRINHFQPIIANVSQSSETATPGQGLTFDVVASDPEGTTLGFGWRANTGVLGTRVNTATTSRAPWTAPACAVAATPTVITATVTNAFNLSATRNFTVTGLPVCATGWATTASLSSARNEHTATLLPNGKVLVAGAYTGSTTLASTLVYDPNAGTWSSAGNLTSARSSLSATLLADGRVLVAGGTNGATDFATAELYDPVLDSWRTTGVMPAARSQHTATLLADGRVLVVGGVRGNTLATADVYDPATGTWSTTGSMSIARYNHTATLLPNGKVLVAGGADGFSTDLGSAEVYDPATGTWSTTGAMGSKRYDHTATLLPNGKVFVTGGGSSTAFAAEVYDPATGTWTSVGAPTFGRGGHTATRLANGKVLVTGGFASSSVLSSAELYTP